MPVWPTCISFGFQPASTTAREQLTVPPIASAACRHAVKGGETVPMEELSWLIGPIVNGDMPPTCPHGRPLMVTLSHTELDRRFRRIQQNK